MVTTYTLSEFRLLTLLVILNGSKYGFIGGSNESSESSDDEDADSLTLNLETSGWVTFMSECDFSICSVMQPGVLTLQSI